MASLTAHLVQSGDHGRLGFHASCPVCRRERLFGSLPSEAIISRRAQAAVASGVLALSAVAPAAALGQEADQQVEGGSGPGGVGGMDEPDTGETGSGQTHTPVPGSDAEPAPPSQPNPPSAPELGSPVPPTGDNGGSDLDQVVPLETEPVENPGHGVDSGAQPELDDQPDEVVRPEPPAEAPPPPAPPPPQTPIEAPATVQPPAVSAAPEAPNQSHATLPAEQTLERTTVAKRTNYTVPVFAGSAPVAATGPDKALTTTATTAAAEPEPPDEPSDGAASERSSHKRFLTVRPGDSLWSIAKRLLGPDASSAQIARQVAHLWELNSQRIGTGRPDLLMVGTKLRLP